MCSEPPQPSLPCGTAAGERDRLPGMGTGMCWAAQDALFPLQLLELSSESVRQL